MPNWCLNKLTVSHSDKSAMDRFVKAYNKGTVCQEFLPEGENWGTKCDIGADEGTEKEERYGLKATVVGNEANCSFDSAWSPPVGLYEKLVELGFKVEATYFEPGMAFCGIWRDGEDYCVEYTDKDMIPKRVWDEYNLGEFFVDEEENV